MNKRDLAIEVTRKLEGTSEAAATRAIDAVLGSISEALQSGQKVSLKGFGTFVVKGRKARTGRNPQTGKTMKIKASKIVQYKQSDTLKKAVNR